MKRAIDYRTLPSHIQNRVNGHLNHRYHFSDALDSVLTIILLLILIHQTLFSDCSEFLTTMVLKNFNCHL